MKNRSLIIAGAVIVAANAFALIHALRNRSHADAQVTLTGHELLNLGSSLDEDSGLALQLQWVDASRMPWPLAGHNPAAWLDQAKLQQLGFDCSVDPSSREAFRYYQRQRARRAYVALEYNGPAWQKWEEAYRVGAEQFQASHPELRSAYPTPDTGRLIAIDAGRDATELRARHPDRTSVIIVPAVVDLSLLPTLIDGKRSSQLYGRITQIPNSIHVPRPFSDQLRNANRNVPYQVQLSYGAAFEPWVTGVSPSATH